MNGTKKQCPKGFHLEGNVCVADKLRVEVKTDG